MFYIFIIILNLMNSKLQVDLKTKRLIDEKGNYKILHGVNVVVKNYPFLPDTTKFDFSNSLNEDDMKNLKSWGMNLIRLGLIWEAVEPTRGSYNQEYLDKVKSIVEMCKQHDIYVILDMHQDAGSRKYCGEGFPDWAVKQLPEDKQFPYPLKLKFEYDEKGYPTHESCEQVVFGKYLATYAVQELFEDLYQNFDKLGDAYAAMWLKIASEFKDYENVLGYEIINEPWVGNLFKNPLDILHCELLHNFYVQVHKSIRSVDNSTIVLFEVPLTDNLFRSYKGTPGGPEYNGKQMLSYHIYTSVEGDPTSELDTFIKSKFLFWKTQNFLTQTQIGGLMSEFGAVSGTTEAGLHDLKVILSFADKRMDSWTYWQFKYYEDHTTAARPSKFEGFYDDKGVLLADKVKILSRPYVVSSSLFIESSELVNDRRLNMSFLKDQQSGTNSIIVFISPQFYFNNDFTVTFLNCELCTWRQSSNRNDFIEIDHVHFPSGIIQLVLHSKSEIIESNIRI